MFTSDFEQQLLKSVKGRQFLVRSFLTPFVFLTKSIEFLLNCTDCNLILAERPAGNEAIDHTEGSGLVEKERERERKRGSEGAGRDGKVDGEIEEGKKE